MNDLGPSLYAQATIDTSIGQALIAEKLIELTVLECCRKLEDDGMVEVAIALKQHFGI